ncbi:hypothetical protein FEF26_13160 [Nesterenkonia salmonea]|uniref:Uncharacterized protein n=1 Tax=Nesterenkonia salmonea TaxID=1804987 RepID=A0A5R9B9Q9_9MICC|nr:hypothetical protein [Nesterenkonia salmonea]TLP93585.1 hypothetical protein FEF26_13160 [Nesterenkonia salmonea]
MSQASDRLPDRMRDLRVEAQPQEAPDLHRLAQVFIGMALDRARPTDTDQQTGDDSDIAVDADRSPE